MIDSYFYGKLVISPLRFFYYNIWLNYSVLFGSHPWHWYLTSGLPVILGLHIVPMISFLFETFRHSRKIWQSFRMGRTHDSPSSAQCVPDFTVRMLNIVSVVFLSGLSLIKHKEFRFLLPLAPVLHICTGYHLCQVSSRVSANYTRYFRYFILLMSISHLIVSLYLGHYHQVCFWLYTQLIIYTRLELRLHFMSWQE